MTNQHRQTQRATTHDRNWGDGMSTPKKDRGEYWRKNISIITWCLVIWALVSLGAGVLFAPMLNGIQLAGYPLGFWFAQQGSIYVFIILIFYYAWRMNRLDREFDVHEE
jgi:putative solute:sodium symporter small subunit